MFERGFKAWCERTSAGTRRALGLKTADRLEPADLAAHLGIELLTPQQIPGLPKDVADQLLEQDPWAWSAVALENIVIYNPRKSRGRQASDIMHEMAHVLLGHEPAQIILSQDGQIGMRSFDQKQEDEANWFAWSLLLPREALVYARRRDLTDSETAETYGVTKALVRFRVSMTGIEAQLGRSGRPRRSG